MSCCQGAYENVYHIKKCVKADILIFKTILSRFVINNPSYVILTFDITMINKMAEPITNLSIKDALVSLSLAFSDVVIDVSSFTGTIVPLCSREIMMKGGELVDSCKSYLAPKSASRLLVRIIVKREIDYCGESLPCDLNICNNSITVNGTIKKMNKFECSYTEEKIQPINVCAKAYCGINIC